MFDPDAFMARLSGPPLVMGILNVTPDSFSDGGDFLDPEAARAQAEAMVADGADIVDIGGESTRPGHTPISADDEAARIAPVLADIAGLGATISIDSYKAPVVAAALEAGAHLINDVWGLQRDPEMAALAARTGAPVICMHNREEIDPDLDIVDEVLGFLARSIDIARAAGVADGRIIADPGFGFGKTFEQSLDLLVRLEEIAALGYPLLVGLSRKGFIGAYSGEPIAKDRLAGTLAANQLAALTGHAAIIRVHDVKPHRQMLDLIAAAIGARP